MGGKGYVDGFGNKQIGKVIDIVKTNGQIGID